MYQLHQNQVSPSEYCAILYGSDPTTTLTTTGIVACGDATSSTDWVFDHETLDNFGYQLKSYSNGVSYVRTGKKTSVTLYTGGTAATSKHNVTLGPGISRHLKFLTLDGNKDVGNWNDITISFSLHYDAIQTELLAGTIIHTAPY